VPKVTHGMDVVLTDFSRLDLGGVKLFAQLLISAQLQTDFLSNLRWEKQSVTISESHAHRNNLGNQMTL